MSTGEMKKERSRSRSPLRSKSPGDEDQKSKENDTKNSLNDDAAKSVKKEVTDTDSNSYILVSNIPLYYFRKKVYEFFKALFGEDRPAKILFDVLEDESGKPTGQCLFKFSNCDECQRLFKKLEGVECDGKPLNAEFDPDVASIKNIGKDIRVIFNDNKPKSKFQNTANTSTYINKNNEPMDGIKNMFLKPAYIDPEPLADHTFGLSIRYLNSLGINPPLKRKICVTNLSSSVDAEKLRKIFSLAGEVKEVLLHFQKPYLDGMAIIAFDHPVEAVQAISMFGQQRLFGKKMLIKMDTKNKPRALPVGLEGIGPGLGINGEPMKGVRAAMEIRNLEKRLEEIEANKEFNQTAGNSANQPNQLLAELTALLSNQTPFQGLGNVLQSLNVPNFNVANLGSNAQNFDQTPFQGLGNLGSNASNFVPNVSNFGQNAPNVSFMGPFKQNFSPNTSNFGSNAPDIGQNKPNFGSHVQSFGHNSSEFNQNISNNRNLSNMIEPQMNAVVPSSNIRQAGPMQANNVNQSAGLSQNTQNWNTQSTNISMQSLQQHGPDGSYYMQQTRFDERRDCDDKFQKNNKDFGNIQHESRNNETEQRQSNTLVFSYLPPSVTAKALNVKMREIGEIVFGEMTGQSRAIVQFKNPRDAETCIKLFDESKVDGQIIKVRYL